MGLGHCNRCGDFAWLEEQSWCKTCRTFIAMQNGVPIIITEVPHDKERVRQAITELESVVKSLINRAFSDS